MILPRAPTHLNSALDLRRATISLLGMNVADCCTNELEFRICTNCKNIQYNVYKPSEKNVNVCYQCLLMFVIFFIVNAFINVYYIFWYV